MQPANSHTFLIKVLPPAVRDVLAHLRNHGSLRFFGKIFVGVFTTFDEVVRKFPHAVSYNSAESERAEIALAEHSKSMAADARRGIAPRAADHYAFLCATVATSPVHAPVVLDVGGGTGEAFAHLIYSCPERKPRLIVYELPPIAAAGRAAFAGDTAISFIHELVDIHPPVDIVFMGSSLQYFENYRALLDEIAALRPRLVIIAYTPMTDAPTFVTAQVNMRGRVIPNKVVNRTELVAHMNTAGFALIYRGESRTEAHFRNFRAPHNTSSIGDMIFARKE